MIRFLLHIGLLCPLFAFGQVKWTNVDSLFGPLPSSVHVFFTDSPVDTGKFRAYYLIADLKDPHLQFRADTAHDRRLTPAEFYDREGHPLVVVNTTFFSYETNRSLNAVIRDGKLVAYNTPMPGKGKDTLTWKHPLGSALGISGKRRADVAWLLTDSASRYAWARQQPRKPWIDSLPGLRGQPDRYRKEERKTFRKWKMKTAVGGGPVLLQNGEVRITNEEELRFTGKQRYDKHPRTAMGYTGDGKLIILMVEGRNPEAGGATLEQEALLLKDLGCLEALNLDGGGSSCLLLNGKETIRPSDKKQRGVPAVFIIETRN